MSVARSLVGATFLTLALVFSASGASAASRAGVAAEVQAKCTADQTACLKAVNDQIASLSCSNRQDSNTVANPNKRSIGCGCSAEGLDVARGLADATTAISKVNAQLATLMAEAVAKNAAGCAQVAFGAVLDGVGTASIGGQPVAGSRG